MAASVFRVTVVQEVIKVVFRSFHSILDKILFFRPHKRKANVQKDTQLGETDFNVDN